MPHKSLDVIIRSVMALRFGRTLIVFALILFATARVIVAQSGNTSSKPQLVPNAKKYAEKGLRPASGRSGSASMTARAVLGRDGVTTVEMTTGAFEGSNARPGNISKVQLKPLDENGNALYARNYVGLDGGGYFTTSVNDLFRGQQVQAQANISGIDAGRTNVVTVVETVKLRPDLIPMHLSGPNRGMVGSAINISVAVRELMGDMGANANLVLYADGVEVDRANGVWVDAGGTVSCVFTHTFTSTGTKQLRVKVEGVAPGDFDDSNNIVNGSVQIGQATPSELNYNVQVVDINEDHRGHVYEKRYFNGVLQSERDETFSSKGWRQSANFYGWTGRMVSFPISISHNDTNDGTPVFSNSYTNLTPTSTIDSSDGVTRFISYNVWRYDSTTGYYFNLYSNASINLSSGQRTEITFFSSNRQAGDITYYSAGYERFWDGYTGEEFFYSWNTSEVFRAGERFAMGTRYGINIELTSADGSKYVASPVVTLGPFDNSNNQPYSCIDWSFEQFSGTSCIQMESIQVGKQGYAYKDSNP